jgi:hypothetical protein
MSENGLRATLCYMEMSEAEQKIFIRVERNRIAKILREARKEVRANKAAHDGIYKA